MKLKFTQRGFPYISFKDFYGERCSLQKSSIATEDCVWLGVDSETLPRMHLTRAQVTKLLPYLQSFAMTGEFADTLSSADNESEVK